MKRRVLAVVLVTSALIFLANPTAIDSLTDSYPGQSERTEERNEMVAGLISFGTRGHIIKSQQVIDAMKAVPRHKFVPAKEQDNAYLNEPLPIGFGQTISQPYIVALMTQLATIEPDMKVLEVGTGSGYQAAILSQLTDLVFSIEIITPLAERTDKLFRELGLDEIERMEGDGYFGWPEQQPFDRILVTAAADHIPPPLVRQLKPGGLMIIPVGAKWGLQHLMVVEKNSNGELSTRSILPVLFVPLTSGSER